MSTWYVASNLIPGDNSSIDMVPNPGDYTDLNTGDKCLVMHNTTLQIYQYDETDAQVANGLSIITPNGNAGNGRWIVKDIMVEGQNGFPIPIGPDSDSAVSFDDGTRTFTIEPAVDEFSFIVQGIKFIKDSAQTVVIDDTNGLHYVYFNSIGTLVAQAPGGSDDDLILYNCLVATIYWDATSNLGILIGDERHGSSMSPATHYHLHESFGATWDYGLSLANFDADGSGDDATAAQFDVVGGTIHDEDIEHTIDAEANATIATYFRQGAGGPWFRLPATAGYPVADGQIGDRLDWNDYNGGAWQLQEVSNNLFVLCHYFATNGVNNPVIGIMGHAEYGNIAAARTGAETELASISLDGLPSKEYVALGTVIFQTSDSYGNQIAARIRLTDTGDDYIDWRQSTITGAGSSAVDHESLGGLLGGAAADHYHLTGTQHTDLTDGGDTTLHDHDGITENTAARHTQNTDTKIIVANTEVTITDAGSGSIDNKVDGSSVVDITASGLRIGNGGSRVLSIVDEDDMTSDSATALATQQSIKAYVDTEKPNSNSIINGDFNIWQRGTSFVAIANGTYTADRFSYHKVGDMVHTVSRDTDVPTQAESGHKSSYSLKVDCTTVDSSIAAGDYCSISHKLEGYSMQAIMGNWATISFWVKATKTGIYCFAMRNSAGDKTWISEYTVSVSDTWEKKTITVNFSDSSGTWLYTNGVGLICTWALATGSTFQSTADSWLATNDWATSNQVNACDNTANNFLLSQVKMEEGETATPYRSRLFSEELALCQRYFQKAIDDDMFAGYAYSTTQAFITIPFKVTLRAEPSTTFVVPTDIRVWYNSDQGTCTSASVNLTSVESVNVIVVCSAAPFTQGDGVLGFINSSAEIWFDAEL